MPGAGIETVTLDESTENPLDAVLAQVDGSGTGPLMIVGLERASPSAAEERPVLYALNMSRPDWPKVLPRPLVLWVPEYLLALLGQEAPDFLDWRSDTLFFADQPGSDLLALDAENWRIDLDKEGMSGALRESRIEELRSRLAALENAAEDPVALEAVAGWLAEMGRHLTTLGDFQGALSHFEQALKVAEKLQRPELLASVYGNLGTFHGRNGEVAAAEAMYQKALQLFQQTGDEPAAARIYGNLASVELDRGSIEAAEKYCLRCLEVAERLGLQADVLSCFGRLAGIAEVRGDLASAKTFLQKALAPYREAEERADLAKVRFQLQLSRILLAEGDLAQAETLMEEAAGTAMEAGARPAVARSRRLLGTLYARRGDYLKAHALWQEALNLYRAMGVQGEAERTQALLEAPAPRR